MEEKNKTNYERINGLSIDEMAEELCESCFCLRWILKKECHRENIIPCTECKECWKEFLIYVRNAKLVEN